MEDIKHGGGGILSLKNKSSKRSSMSVSFIKIFIFVFSLICINFYSCCSGRHLFAQIIMQTFSSRIVSANIMIHFTLTFTSHVGLH